MKVAIVCPYDYFRPGGVQSHVAAEYDELKKLGYDVRIIAPLPTDNKTRRVKDLIFLGTSTSMRINAPFHTQFDVTAVDNEDIQAVLDKEKFDILHVHEPWLPVLPYQIMQINESAIVVGTLHGTWPDSTINNSLQKMITPYVKPAIKRLDYITAVSEPPVEKIKNLTTKHINFIPNGIDLDYFDPSKVEALKEYQDDVATIFFLGRLERRKGVDYLIKAYVEAKKQSSQPMRLVIAGDGPKRKSLESYVERFDVADVRFLGRVSEEMKLSLLKSCTLFCSPAIFGESFGIVLLEAMAMGAPIVAGFNEGYQTVLSGVGQLAMVDPRNKDEFARRLNAILESPEIRDILIDWGYAEVQKYSYTRIVGQYDELFKDILTEEQ